MLKSCPYCGRIHESTYNCGRKPKKVEYKNNRTSFRWSYAWKTKREYIRKRDKGLCQCCIRNMPGTERLYNYAGTEVHHIEPLEECEERKLDNTNLITLCRVHHEMAEAGETDRYTLHKIAEEQERKSEEETRAV